MPRRTSATAPAGGGPVRTCVGCRERAAQSELLRLVARDGALLPDPERRMPGRGAYVHPTEQCWRRAERRRPWARALRTGAQLDTAPAAERLTPPPSG